jgi:hypothetical protein
VNLVSKLFGDGACRGTPGAQIIVGRPAHLNWRRFACAAPSTLGLGHPHKNSLTDPYMRSMSKIVVTLDSQIHDVVAADPVLQARLKECQSAGLISVITTHIQQSELSDIPQAKDIGQADAVDAVSIGASAAVWDRSLWDVDRLATPEAAAVFDHIQNRSARNTEDAMIGTTAYTDADILVTDDSRLRRRFQSLGSPVEVLSSAQFADRVASLCANIDSQPRPTK